MKILALDTATEQCSAALWLNGPSLAREEQRPRGHGERILPMIDELLREAQLTLRDLDVIAFGRGPGAFTGVRLALSIAQGLGLAADLPLIGVSDLGAVALQAMQRALAPQSVLVCQDARMSEIYWGCFQRCGSGVETIGVESVTAPGAVSLPQPWNDRDISGGGSGFQAYRSQLAPIAARLTQVYDTLLPRAREIAQLASVAGMQCAVAPEHAYPVYLRDDVAAVPVMKLS